MCVEYSDPSHRLRWYAESMPNGGRSKPWAFIHRLRQCTQLTENHSHMIEWLWQNFDQWLVSVVLSVHARWKCGKTPENIAAVLMFALEIFSEYDISSGA